MVISCIGTDLQYLGNSKVNINYFGMLNYCKFCVTINIMTQNHWKSPINIGHDFDGFTYFYKTNS